MLQLSGIAAAQVDPLAGQRTYALCAGCHGFDGEGNRLIDTPGLAGIEPWYLERQLEQFLQGRRGSGEPAQRMAIMARAIGGEPQFDNLAAHVATLRVLPAEEVAGGSVDTGRDLFATCAACHGPDGAGNEALSSPALARMDAWYLIEQLRLFAEGQRGSEPGDVFGAQMRALATLFDTDQERLDLAAFIVSLR